MKVHRLVFYIVDFDEVGAQGAVDMVVNARYPNRAISPHFVSAETWDVGDWHDDHPLNQIATSDACARDLFSTPPETTLRGDD